MPRARSEADRAMQGRARVSMLTSWLFTLDMTIPNQITPTTSPATTLTMIHVLALFEDLARRRGPGRELGVHLRREDDRRDPGREEARS